MNFVVNMNGDSFDSLSEQYFALNKAIHDVEKALSAIHPNGRNYQTLDTPSVALKEDVQRHREAIAALRVIDLYAYEYAERLADQIPA